MARCTVERLMRELVLSGVRRGRGSRAPPRSDEGQRGPSDLVERKFVAPVPNRLRGRPDRRENAHRLGLTAFIVDVHALTVVGWQLSNSL